MITVARREHASASELQSAVSLHVLDALSIAMRSPHDRIVLLSLGLFQCLFKVIKARK